MYIPGTVFIGPLLIVHAVSWTINKAPIYAIAEEGMCVKTKK